jgi:hypothetical protein
MTATVPYALKVTGTTATTSVGTITAPTVGNTLLVLVTIPTANAPIAGFTDNLGNTYIADVSASALNGGFVGALYRKTNLSNAPTILSVTGTTGSFAATFTVVEVAGLDNAAPLVSTVPRTDINGGASAATHTLNYTTSNSSDFVFSFVATTNGRTLNSATNSFSIVPSESVGSFAHAVYLTDAGAAGAKSTLITLSANASVNIFGGVYKSAFTGPTVSTVTSPGTTETGNMVFTASLSGATSGSTNYAFTLGGTATAGADYTSPLTSAMCSNGVTVVGSDFVVPTAVSSWTVTIQTTSDTIDETNETIILTIGDTASTGGTITDDDPVPAWSVSDASTVTAGSPAIFTISADRASSLVQNLTLGFIDGTLVGGVGYDNTITNPDLSNGVTISAGVITIPAGITSFTVSVGTM